MNADTVFVFNPRLSGFICGLNSFPAPERAIQEETKLSTLKQAAANRRNAMKSTGPRSVAGRAVASQNALKTGMHAKSLIIRGESAEDLETLTALYYLRYATVDLDELVYVDILIRDSWQLRPFA